MTRAFCDDKFTGFEREYIPTTFVCFKDYDESIPNKLVAFKKEEIKNTFGEFLANNGKKQLRLAETEKYAHVTFFFNGGVEDPNVDEFRLLVNSPKDVPTYDLKPEMSAPEVGMDLVEAIKSDKYDVIVINFANPDMVGHTGVIPAAVKAVEKVGFSMAYMMQIKEGGSLGDIYGNTFAWPYPIRYVPVRTPRPRSSNLGFALSRRSCRPRGS